MGTGSTASRRLEALSLLNSTPVISAPSLAARLGVTERTARRDVAHLRELGYRIDGASGRTGGYRLAHGRAMPPLLLDADEVAAVALALSHENTALAKLRQLVPARWQARLAALADIQVAPDGPSVNREVLIPLALAGRAGEAVRLKQRRPVDVQPHRLVALRRRWYLVGCPRDGTNWHVYAVDRIEHVQPLGIRLPAPAQPDDAVQFVADTLARGPWKHKVHVRVHTSADLVRELVDPGVAVVVSTQDECELHFATEDLDWAARWLVYLNLDLDVVAPPALNDRLRALGEWLLRRYDET